MIFLLISTAVCVGAWSVGWAFGPIFLRIASNIKNSAEYSQKKAKAGNDYLLPFHEYLTPDYIDDHHFKRFQREHFLIFVPIILALIFNTTFLWILVAGVFLWILWKEALQLLIEIIIVLFNFIVGAGGEKKK